eukprot:1625008-Pyramimonas_sp.AAC.1
MLFFRQRRVALLAPVRAADLTRAGSTRVPQPYRCRQKQGQKRQEPTECSLRAPHRCPWWGRPASESETTQKPEPR